MGEAKRKRQTNQNAAGPRDPRIGSEKVKELEAFLKGMMKIDPSGALLCAFGLRIRDEMDFVIARKGSGMQNDEILAAGDSGMRAWLSQGPEKIIREFDDRMRTELTGMPSGTTTH